MLILLAILSAGASRADSLQYGPIGFDLPAQDSAAQSGENDQPGDSGGYGSCTWGRPCRPPPGAACPAIAYGNGNVTRSECHASCSAEGVDLENQSLRNGTCHWQRYEDGRKRPEGAAVKRSSCHLHIPRGDGPAEGSVAVPRSLEECEADCERKKLFELVGSRCEWRSAEGRVVRIK